MDDPYGRSLNHKFTGNAVQIESPYHDTNPCLAFGTNKPSGRTERDKADSRAFHALDAAPRLGALLRTQSMMSYVEEPGPKMPLKPSFSS